MSLELKYLMERLNIHWMIDGTLLSTVRMTAAVLAANACPNAPVSKINPYPTEFPYGNGMVLHFYQQQESSTTKTVHKVINKGLKTYV